MVMNLFIPIDKMKIFKSQFPSASSIISIATFFGIWWIREAELWDETPFITKRKPKFLDSYIITPFTFLVTAIKTNSFLVSKYNWKKVIQQGR